MDEEEPAEYVKKKYSREDEVPIPWKLNSLRQVPSEVHSYISTPLPPSLSPSLPPHLFITLTTSLLSPTRIHAHVHARAHTHTPTHPRAMTGKGNLLQDGLLQRPPSGAPRREQREGARSRGWAHGTALFLRYTGLLGYHWLSQCIRCRWSQWIHPGGSARRRWLFRRGHDSQLHTESEFHDRCEYRE